MAITVLMSLAGVNLSWGDAKVHDLKDLKEGETRTLSEGDTKVTATRKGDTVHLVVVDKDGKEHAMEIGATGKAVLMSMEGGKDMAKVIVSREDDGEEQKKVMVIATGAGHPGELTMLDVGDDAAGGAMVWHTEGGEVIKIDDDAVFLRCPQGDTTMQLAKDDAKGTFYCPKHNVVLEEQKGKGAFCFKTKVIKKEIVEEEKEVK
jgi:hypothetical protein